MRTGDVPVSKAFAQSPVRYFHPSLSREINRLICRIPNVSLNVGFCLFNCCLAWSQHTINGISTSERIFSPSLQRRLQLRVLHCKLTNFSLNSIAKFRPQLLSRTRTRTNKRLDAYMYIYVFALVQKVPTLARSPVSPCKNKDTKPHVIYTQTVHGPTSTSCVDGCCAEGVLALAAHTSRTSRRSRCST